jgi:predicted nucleotidyltransferase
VFRFTDFFCQRKGIEEQASRITSSERKVYRYWRHKNNDVQDGRWNNHSVNEQEIRKRLASLEEPFAQLGVQSLLLFGSAVRGTSGPDSDMDFVVEFEGRATFDRYMDLRELLERELQPRIDLVTLRALKPVLREQILSEAVRVA